uniref:Uncharacterized protein n=1 Tax=Avena sativa TaxID=4498 RepID=A0ACD5T6F8_AVESA
MVGGVVSVVTGVMNPLIVKLTALAGDEYKKLKGVRRQASFLLKELSAMNAALHKMELMDELDPTVKDWRDHVREMSYDMENCIDDFMHHFGRDDAKAGFIKKTTRRLKKLWQRHWIAARIKDLKNLAIEANARRERYKIDDCKPSSGSGAVDVAIDPRLRAVYQEAANLVGIDGPMEELASWLMDTQEKLKVVSIMGFGGLGKTTLAKQMYDKFRQQFHCEAFFSVSHKPDVKLLFNRLEAKLHMTQFSHAREIEDIIQDIREHLKNKRNSMPPLLLFKYIRVLTLEGGYRNSTIDVTAINQLFQLRYLRVEAGYGSIELPCALKRLVYLETMDLYGDLNNNFPSDIVYLPCLSYLRLPSGATGIQGVENMKSLRTLLQFNLNMNSVKDIRGLGELTNLRELELIGDDVETSKNDALVCSVGKLRNLRNLHISSEVVTDETTQLCLLSSSPFEHIETLELWFWEFPRVPKWMGDLHCLRFMYLRATETSAEDVQVLGKLASLVLLDFRTRQITGAERAVLGKGVFPVLEHFLFWPSKGDVTAFLVLEEGAMPKLRTLRLEVHEWGGSTLVGMKHLILLKEIYLYVPGDTNSSGTKDDVISAFRKQASELHPNRPSVNAPNPSIQRVLNEMTGSSASNNN